MENVGSYLKSRPSIGTQEFSENSQKLFGECAHDWIRIDDDIILHIANFTALEYFRLRNDRFGFLCFEIALKNEYIRRIEDRENNGEVGTVLISNSISAEYEIASGSRARGIIVYCDRKRFMEKFQLDIARVQERSRPIFLNEYGSFGTLRVPLFSSTMADVDQILNCNFQNPLRPIFLAAKVMEILCTLVAQINEYGAGPRPFSTRGLKVRTIEAAADIYKRELHNPPTIEELAERIGSDKRELTKGFQELFGKSPHRYHLQQRMEQAELLLKEGKSLSEVGRLVGYQGYRTFSRAYRTYHGRPLIPNSPIKK